MFKTLFLAVLTVCCFGIAAWAQSIWLPFLAAVVVGGSIYLDAISGPRSSVPKS